MTTTTRTKTTDILEIAAALDGKINFTDIKFSQVLPCAHGEGVNDLKFIRKQHGVFFYTSRTAFENMTNLVAPKFDILVCCEGSKNLYQLKGGI